MWNIVRNKVRTAQVKIRQDKIANVRMLAPNPDCHAGVSKLWIMIGWPLLVALFLLIATPHETALQYVKCKTKGSFWPLISVFLALLRQQFNSCRMPDHEYGRLVVCPFTVFTYQFLLVHTVPNDWQKNAHAELTWVYQT